jgi:phage shock protein PspC (stress-responsive transcriptional regulator)
MKKKLRRSATDVKICGVCGGIAEYLGVDSNLVRLIWIAVSLFAGTGILLYILAAVLMPKANEMQKDLQEVVQPEHSGADA